MRAESWMNRDERPLGTKVSDLQALARDLRQAADRLERDARKMRQDADDAERKIENLRVAP